MRASLYLLASGVAAFIAFGANAEDLDCKKPVTQADMTACEQARQETADKALNAQYKVTRAALAALDKDLGADGGAEKALVKAQRAWVDFRDAECEATGFQARGGTMEPMLVAGCIAELTDQRTKQLKELAETMGN
ncbi:urease-associated protein [Rhizobium sp. R72]|uniref:lysozyme inhibitor LprI family protein n=1 Tax=unclassified Rhizobium TaxID=2613769 RepID=UPI000B52CA7C|nr:MULTISPECIES: lysozyme inhibitor LprI family protein [unclassified Rhizobium]OWV82941.1 urease-associated protein [Rhizobium sp. R693]OWV93707.1 urease-associated protein [Rhizobium sp. R72]OWV93945.1 urease-associated protein [Rhizobium sp. R711]